MGFSRKYYTEAERRDEDARMYPSRGIALPAPDACPEATADTRRPVRFPDTMAQPPAFLLKRKTMTPDERITRYRSLLERVGMLAYSDYGRNRYWARHECRLRYLIMGNGGL